MRAGPLDERVTGPADELVDNQGDRHPDVGGAGFWEKHQGVRLRREDYTMVAASQGGEEGTAGSRDRQAGTNVAQQRAVTWPAEGDLGPGVDAKLDGA